MLIFRILHKSNSNNSSSSTGQNTPLPALPPPGAVSSPRLPVRCLPFQQLSPGCRRFVLPCFRASDTRIAALPPQGAVSTPRLPVRCLPFGRFLFGCRCYYYSVSKYCHSFYWMAVVGYILKFHQFDRRFIFTNAVCMYS